VRRKGPESDAEQARNPGPDDQEVAGFVELVAEVLA
jgi:hypothetical protein